jgi:ribosomal protein L32
MEKCMVCGHALKLDDHVCPNCGATLTGGVWPPSVRGRQAAFPPEQRLITSSAWGDLGLGILVLVLLLLVYGIGLIAVPIIYGVTFRTYKTFARALGWTYIAAIMALIAVFCICLVVWDSLGRV